MSQLVRLTAAGALAVHACALLACSDAPLPASDMARRLGASEAHLAKVLQRLSHGGIVAGTRGPGGGFRLLARPEGLTLRNVYELVEGPLVIRGCLLGIPLSGGVECLLGTLLKRVNTEIAEGLAGVTVADLCPARERPEGASGGREDTHKRDRMRKPVVRRR